MKYFVIISLLLLSSCGLETPYFLPEKIPVNPELSGVWQEKEQGKSMLIITKKNATRYNLEVIFDKTNEDTEKSNTEFFEFAVGNHKIVNILNNNKSGKQMNMFCTYTLNPDELVFRFVSKPEDDIVINSSESLLNYFKNHIDDPGFFDTESVTMVRLK